MSEPVRIIAGPFNRVEGDLEITLDIGAGTVQDAYVNAPLFRGFEPMLTGKHPMDALVITPRICGICSISQSAAAAAALADAIGIVAPGNGQRVAALIHAVENISDHLMHFNLFFMPDFTRPDYAGRAWHGETAERFAATRDSAQRACIQARSNLMHILGLLAGKWPHTLAIQPGGVTKTPTARDKVRMGATLRAHRSYIEHVVLGGPVEDFAALATMDDLLNWRRGDAGLFLRIAADIDLISMGKSAGRYLSYGAYPVQGKHFFASGIWEGALKPLTTGGILEDPAFSWMLGGALHPSEGQTLPDEDMSEPAYTWCKAPRIDGKPYETGAVARQLIDGHPLARSLVEAGGGVLARVACRLLEVARVTILMEELLESIDPQTRFMDKVELPDRAVGEGLVEAARGALGHWIRIEKGKIANYQIIAPTSWNFSPRDGMGQRGPLEAALVGAPADGERNPPLAVQHIVRSFDPCMVCTVH